MNASTTALSLSLLFNHFCSFDQSWLLTLTIWPMLISWPVDQFDCPIAAWHVAECSLSRIRVSLTLWLLMCYDGCCCCMRQWWLGLVRGVSCWCVEDDGEKMEVLRVKCGGRRRTTVADGDGGSRWREVQMRWWCWQICGGCRDWCVVVMVAARVWGKLGFLFWRWRWWRGSLPLDSMLVQGLLPRGLFWLANFKSWGLPHGVIWLSVV